MTTVLVMLGYLAIGYLLTALRAYFGKLDCAYDPDSPDSPDNVGQSYFEEIDSAYDLDTVGVSTELLEELVTGLLFWPFELFGYLFDVLFSESTLLFICKPLIAASRLGAARRDKLGRDSR